MLFKGCSEAKAKIKVKNDSKWVDTLDEDAFEHVKSDIEDTVDDYDNQDRAQQFQTDVGDKEPTTYVPETPSTRPTTPRMVGIKRLDNVTSGHGVDAGITDSILSPNHVKLRTKSGQGNGDEDLCIPLNSPSVHPMPCSPPDGPISNLENLPVAIPSVYVSKVDTPTSAYFKQYMKNVASPDNTGSNDNEDGANKISIERSGRIVD
ncbi:unnamed protein product [Calypogeia fissa]